MKKLLLITTALTALGAGPVCADPISGAIMSAFTAFSATTVGAAVIKMATGMAFGLLSVALTSALSDDPKIDVNFDVEFGDDTSLAFVVGDYATSGKLKYAGTWGKSTRYYTQVFEISSLPITGLADAWVDDEIADIDRSVNRDDGGYVITNFSEGTKPRGWIHYLDGTQTEADPFLVEKFGGDEDYPWTAEMIGTGKAYAVMTWYYDPEVMTSAPTSLFQPNPLPLCDPRRDSTVGGDGSHRWGETATYEASNNPGVICYNIARGIYYDDEWVWGGKNLAAGRLPFDEWVAAMNACDEPVELSDGTTEPAYRAGAEITVDMEPLDVMETIGRCANMRFAEVGGMLKPLVGLSGAAVFSITDDDIILTEEQSLTPFYTASETYNAISATYPEPEEKWETKDAPEYVDEDARAADGGRYLPVSVTFESAPYAQQVQRLQRSQMLNCRRMRSHQYSLPPAAYVLEPLDMVSWSSERNGYQNKLFLVESVAKAAGMNVSVQMRECDASDYDWDKAWEKPVTITSPKNVIKFTQTIEGFAAVPTRVTGSDGQERPAIRVSCDGDEVGVSDIRLQVRLLGETQAQLDVTRPFDEPYEWLITEVLANTGYQVRGQLLSDLSAKTEWSGWITVTTDDSRLSVQDLSDSLQQILDELNAWIADLNIYLGGLPDVDVDLSTLPPLYQDLSHISAMYRSLSDDIRAVAAEVMEGSAQRLSAEQQVRDSATSAEYTLGARITETADSLRLVSAAVTDLQSTIPDLATTEALQSLQTTVEQTEASLTALSELLTTLSAAIDDKADVTALESLTAQVTEQAGTLTAAVESIEALQAELTGKASATGLEQVEAKVSQQGEDLAATAERVKGVETALTGKADTQALETLSATVTEQGGQIDTLSEAVTALQATVNDNADAQALESLTAQIIAQADTFGISNGSSATFPIMVSGDEVYFAKGMIGEAWIDTLHITDGAVTNVYTAQYIGTHRLDMGGDRSILSTSFSANAGDK